MLFRSCTTLETEIHTIQDSACTIFCIRPALQARTQIVGAGLQTNRIQVKMNFFRMTHDDEKNEKEETQETEDRGETHSSPPLWHTRYATHGDRSARKRFTIC